MLAGLGPVTFSTGQSSILEDAEVLLFEVVAILNAYPETKFALEGHTDSKFTEKFNQKLSEKRAASVLNFLISNGIEASRLSTVGFGELAPIAPNDSAPINEPPPKVIALCNHPGPQSLVYAFSFAPVPLFSTELSSSFSFVRVSSFSVIYKCELI